MKYKTGIGYMYYNSGVKNVIMDLRISKWIVISEFNGILNEMIIINKPIWVKVKQKLTVGKLTSFSSYVIRTNNSTNTLEFG